MTVLSKLSYPYNRRIAGAHGNFSKQAHRKWLKEADREALAHALSCLAQLNQPKVYLFWKESES